MAAAGGVIVSRSLALALVPAAAHLVLGPLLPAAWAPAGLAALLLAALALSRVRAPLLRYTVCACLLPPLYAALRRALSLSPGPGLSWPLLLLAHAASALALTALERLPRAAPATASRSPAAAAQLPLQRTITRRLLALSRPDLLPLAGAFIFLALAVIGGMFVPYYTGKVIDILGSQYDQRIFLFAIFCMCATSMGSSIAAGVRGGLFMFTMSRLSRRIRSQLFSSLVQQEIAFFDATKAGDITSRLSTDTTLMSRSVGLNVNVLLRSLVNTLGIISFMFSLSWKLTLLIFIESPLTILIQKLYNRYHMSLVLQVQDSIASSNQLAGEIVSSIKTVRSFAAEDLESELFEKKLQETHQLKNKRDLVRAVYLLCHRLAMLLMQVVMLYCGQLLVNDGQMTSGNLIAFILYQMDFGIYVRTLIRMYSEMTHSVGAAEKVFEYLDREPSVRTDGTLVPESLQGHLEFKDVTFSYPTKPDVPVLQDVSFEVRAGEVTALVGPSGGGKTTCVSLLQRFYKPQSGHILLDGRHIKEYEHKYYHSKVALVGQEPTLFALSVQDNIRYGLDHCPQADVAAAAQSASARDFIERMDQGFDTDVGEDGGQISAGQKQRIAIARALVRKPRILILDEATSSLDTHTELSIQRALAREPVAAVLVIAHRLKTVQRADRIVVLEGGRVVERGTHTQLMELGGCYSRLVLRQFTNGEQGAAGGE
ncbi:antigen peptide transporter 2-like isoform X2 [Leucoraja erinacea]|uniref:antigen peptide transporter 2-like isoform X2 n=1 Tax=Leucoraja erinaceus TaxID=7782 RepID=UPI0024563162|nr:antigen peptide transporter 2-like isoform X2 [Leucoraja erinacea]